MHDKLKLSEAGVGKPVPDETLERVTKVPLNDDRGDHEDRQSRLDASFVDSVKKELNHGR
jgi:hypothetical protein